MAAAPKTRFVANPLFEQQLERDPMLLDDIKAMAQNIFDQLPNTVPVGEGEHLASYTVEVELGADGVIGYVVSKDKKAYFIEFGEDIVTMHAPLRRAVEAAGYKLEGDGRGDS